VTRPPGRPYAEVPQSRAAGNILQAAETKSNGHGGVRLGSGRKPKTLFELLVAGSFRPQRHISLFETDSSVAVELVAAIEAGDDRAPWLAQLVAMQLEHGRWRKVPAQQNLLLLRWQQTARQLTDSFAEDPVT
jgi:hypothetical protein